MECKDSSVVMRDHLMIWLPDKTTDRSQILEKKKPIHEQPYEFMRFYQQQKILPSVTSCDSILIHW